jgi:hypothetical protein
MTFTLEIDLPDGLPRLPDAVAARLQNLLDRREAGQPLTEQECAEAEGLVELNEFLQSIRLQAERQAAVAPASGGAGGSNGPAKYSPHAEGSRQEDFPAIGTEAWGRMNERRAALIHKKNRHGLTAAEQKEFERLQRLVEEATEKAFPRPPLDYQRLEALENRLLNPPGANAE